MRMGFGVLLPQGEEIAARTLNAFPVEVALGRIGQMGIDGQPFIRNVPRADFLFVRVAHCAAVIRADKLLRGNAVQLEGRVFAAGMQQERQPAVHHARRAQTGRQQQRRLSAPAARRDEQRGNKQGKSEKPVVAQKRRADDAEPKEEKRCFSLLYRKLRWVGRVYRRSLSFYRR